MALQICSIMFIYLHKLFLSSALPTCCIFAWRGQIIGHFAHQWYSSTMISIFTAMAAHLLLIRYQLVKPTLPDSRTIYSNKFSFYYQGTFKVTRRCQSTLNSFRILLICANGNELDFTHKDKNQYINMTYTDMSGKGSDCHPHINYIHMRVCGCV